MFTAFLEPVITLRSYANSLACLLLKPKPVWNPKRSPLVKLVVASVDVRINFFFRSKVDKIVSAWLIITREATLWSVVGLHISPSICETISLRGYTANSWFLLWEKNTQNEHIIAQFEYFFTCRYSKTASLAENLNEIKIIYYEKNFSHIKQTFPDFEKGLKNVLTKKTFFLSHWD